MKIIHTSDWHLGQKFLTRDREEEHQLALDWLYQLIITEKIDVLIVAGDIFDIGNPPNYARRLYYQFLTSLIGTCCRHVIITGGNHDSPAMLDAPRDLLQHLNMHILGAATGDPSDQIWLLKDSAGKVELVVAAVPFLRDRDLRTSVSGESGLDRINRVQAAMREHYRVLGELVTPYATTGVPILTTGHCYAVGAEATDRQDNIYLGNTENIAATDFPAIFSYVALGHIHRPQLVGQLNHVRYSGSLIPLSFSETKDDKGVYQLTYSGADLEDVTFRPLPVFRRLKTIEASPDDAVEKLRRFAARREPGLPPWVEILVEAESVPPQFDMTLRELGAELGVEVLRVRLLRRRAGVLEASLDQELEELDVREVFRERCAAFETDEAMLAELEQSFIELQEWRESDPQP